MHNIFFTYLGVPLEEDIFLKSIIPSSASQTHEGVPATAAHLFPSGSPAEGHVLASQYTRAKHKIRWDFAQPRPKHKIRWDFELTVLCTAPAPPTSRIYACAHRK